MEIEQHASAVSSEIGFQSVGAVSSPDALSCGRILKRAQRNGFLDPGRSRKARKLNNNHVKNIGSNTNPKSTRSKNWNKNEGNNSREMQCFGDDDNDVVTNNDKGLPTDGLVGKSLKTAIEINGCDALAFQEADKICNGVSNETKSEEGEVGSGVDRKDRISNHKLCGIQQNTRYLIISKKQKGQLSFNGHCILGSREMKHRKEGLRFKSKCFEKDSSTSGINSSLGGIGETEIGRNVERCGNVANGVNHASGCCNFGEGKCVSNNCKNRSIVEKHMEDSFPRRNGILENKCIHLEKGSYSRGFKRVRLKNSLVNHDTNTGRKNSNFRNFPPNDPSDEKVHELNSCDVSYSKLTEAADNGFFKTVNRSNNNHYHTKQKSRDFNTTEHIANNIVEDDIKKRNSNIDEKAAPEVKVPSRLDLKAAPEQVPAINTHSSSGDCKESNSQNDGVSTSSSVVCNWVNCDAKLSDAMELKTHVKEVHVKPMAASDLFFCFWKGCKVYNKPSSSYNWLVKHVNTHVGIRPFQCVIEPCSLSFASQGALIRHVQSHFNERSKYYKKPKNPVKEAAPSPGQTEETLSGSESTSSKESKRRKSKIFMRRTRHLNSNSANDDLDRNAMSYIKKKLCHLESNPGKPFRINGLRSVFQPFGRRTLEDDRSQLLMAINSNEKYHKWYNENEVLVRGLCQLPIMQLPIEQQDKMYLEVFGAPKQRHGRKYKKEGFT